MVGLAFNIDPAGRLLILPTGRRHVASLRLTASSADILSPGLAPVALAWDAYGEFSWPGDGALHDGWVFTHFAGRRRPCGLSVRVGGAYDVACHEMFAATTTPWRRLVHSREDDMRTGHRIPIVPTIGFVPSLLSERPTLAALATVVARLPELRRALSNPQRTARLAADLAAGMLPAPPTRTGGRRETVDILFAMHATGVFHRFGRPLPGESLPALDEIVALIHSRLSASPYRKGDAIDDYRIAKLARSRYLDVAPWPFAALLP